MYPHSEQGNDDIIILYTDAGSFIFFASHCLSVLSSPSPSPSLPLGADRYFKVVALRRPQLRCRQQPHNLMPFVSEAPP